MEDCSLKKVAKWIMESLLVRIIKRFLPLFTACWMFVDIALDINQTITYYRLYGFEGQGSYETWAIEHQNSTNSTHLEKMSAMYFYTACSVWVTPPILLTALYIATIKILVLSRLLEEFFSYEMPLPRNKILLSIIWIVIFPVELVSSMIVIYVLIPYAALKNGVKCAWNGHVDKNKDLVFGIDVQELPAFKTFEFIGEALPQIILSIIIAAHNYPFLLTNDTYFDIPIPITVISIIFSFGSLIIGLLTAFPSCVLIIMRQ